MQHRNVAAPARPQPRGKLEHAAGVPGVDRIGPRDSAAAAAESVVAADWPEVRRQGMNLPPEIAEEDRSRLQNAAMESLREIGNAESIEALRAARQQAVGMTITLRQLSFDVAEDIYWRQTGGLSGESFDARKG